MSKGISSPRPSPAMRPSTPLSPAHKALAHFDPLQAPRQRPMHSRTNSGQHRRAPNPSFRFPALPRFHPANYPSAQSSLPAPSDGNSHSSSPQSPVSPRAYQRMYNDAQKQLYFHQRDFLSLSVAMGSPTSPRLRPLGSPGPVTPLELEGDEGYLVAGARGMNGGALAPSDVADKLAKAEVELQRKRFADSSAGRCNR